MGVSRRLVPETQGEQWGQGPCRKTNLRNSSHKNFSPCLDQHDPHSQQGCCVKACAHMRMSVVPLFKCFPCCLQNLQILTDQVRLFSFSRYKKTQEHSISKAVMMQWATTFYIPTTGHSKWSISAHITCSLPTIILRSLALLRVSSLYAPFCC